jgi:hypothetical protein
MQAHDVKMPCCAMATTTVKMAATTTFDVSKPLVHFISCGVKATTNNKVRYHMRAHDICIAVI